VRINLGRLVITVALLSLPKPQVRVTIETGGYWSTDVFISYWRFNVYSEHVVKIARVVVRRLKLRPVESDDDGDKYRFGPFEYNSLEKPPFAELVTLHLFGRRLQVGMYV
jgi:hypothetical protein